MTSASPVQVKFLSDKSDIERLHSYLRERTNTVDIQRHGTEKDPSNLAFGIAEVAALVALFKDALPFLEMGKFIFELLHDTSQKKIVIQTPMRRIELVSSVDLTRAEIDEALAALVKVAQ